MSNHETLTAALLAAFNLDADKADPAVIAGAAAGVLVALQEPALIELRKQTMLLETIAEQGRLAARSTEDAMQGNRIIGLSPATGASASGLPG